MDLFTSEVSPGRTEDTPDVYSWVLVEIAILDGDGSLVKVEGHLLQRHDGAIAPAGIEDLIQEVLACAVVYLGGLEGLLSGLYVAWVGQSLGEMGVDPGHGAEGGQDHQ